MFDPAMFERSADVRGVYPNQINEELAWLSGKYLVRSLKKMLGDDITPGILVGRDGRTSSPAIYGSLMQGIAAEGGATNRLRTRFHRHDSMGNRRVHMWSTCRGHDHRIAQSS
ncbi:hypothetical protein N8553_04090 [bacterium]|nr:hypothetical protein [bacterium]